MQKKHRFFEKQIPYLITLAILVVLTLLFAETRAAQRGSLWHLSTTSWLWITIITALLHQYYVMFCWRLQLHFHYLMRTLRHAAIPFYVTGFYILILLRLAALIMLAISNANTLYIPLPVNTLLLLTITVFVISTLYSAAKYLGPLRLTGMDHFLATYRHKPLARKGMFRFTSNPIYKYGGLIAFLPGLIGHSTCALIAGSFTYFAIWAHYYFTEKPDMQVIYKHATKLK